MSATCTLSKVQWVSKELVRPKEFRFGSFLCYYSAKIEKPKKFYQKSVFLYVSGGFLKFIQSWLNISAWTQQIHL